MTRLGWLSCFARGGLSIGIRPAVGTLVWTNLVTSELIEQSTPALFESDRIM